MIDLFECCSDIASVGIIVDFSEDTETYIVGTPADIKAWAYGGCPMKAPKGLMRHSNKAGNLVKDINRLMKVKYELNDDYKKRAMADPIKEAYLNFDNKCRSYRKKLSGYPDLLDLFMMIDIKNFV